jgi:hypothetical protein
MEKKQVVFEIMQLELSQFGLIIYNTNVKQSIGEYTRAQVSQLNQKDAAGSIQRSFHKETHRLTR